MTRHICDGDPDECPRCQHLISQAEDELHDDWTSGQEADWRADREFDR